MATFEVHSTVSHRSLMNKTKWSLASLVLSLLDDCDRLRERGDKPIPMLLFCPECGLQHVDAADEAKRWSNPPHRSHLCGRCGCIWRPADVPTTGVARIETRGNHDSWVVDVGAVVNACEAPGDAALRYIEQLRAAEGNSVEILCNDPEAWEREKQMAIEVCADWTDWGRQRFYGESVLQCLAKAVGAMEAAQVAA